MKVYIENTGHIKKSWKFQNFILVLGVRKIDFYDFSGKFLRKNGLEYGNHEWDDGHPGTTSETTGALGASSETTGALEASSETTGVWLENSIYNFLGGGPKAGTGTGPAVPAHRDQDLQ